MNTKLAANYGTIAGLIAFGYFIILALLGQNPVGSFQIFASVIPVFILYYATKKYRDVDLNGNMRFGQGFIFSLTTTFFFATIFAALVYVYGKVIEPDLIELIKSDTLKNVDKMEDMLGSDSKILDEAIKQLETMNIGQIAWGQYWNKIIWGFILSLIIAGILKKEKPLFDDTFDNNA